MLETWLAHPSLGAVLCVINLAIQKKTSPSSVLYYMVTSSSSNSITTTIHHSCLKLDADLLQKTSCFHNSHHMHGCDHPHFVLHMVVLLF